VVGFGNLEFAEMMAPPLTTLEQSAGEIGREAARMALARTEKRGGGGHLQERIPEERTFREEDDDG
jgi:DNA-binding LacI/PurR family transcriptional regulator